MQDVRSCVAAYYKTRPLWWN